MYLFNAANKCPLRWRHSERDGVSNHQPQDCLLNRLFRRRSGKTSKLCVTGIFAGNSPVTSEVPAQRASNAENVSIWGRHHGLPEFWYNWVRVMIFYVIFESESAHLMPPLYQHTLHFPQYLGKTHNACHVCVYVVIGFHMFLMLYCECFPGISISSIKTLRYIYM